MASNNPSSGRDAQFSGHPSWVYESPDVQLADIISVVNVDSTSDLLHACNEVSFQKGPVYLVQTEEAVQCTLSLRCPPQRHELIGSVLLISEARTMEVYSGAGEYCGTCRGELDPSLYLGSTDDRRPLYKKHLILEYPATSCEVKLLSLGGRARVGVGGIVLGLRPPDRPPASGPGIDLQCVQSLVDSMGATLSPGAQNLLDMVQFQQKNKMDLLGGFLPFFMGGGPMPSLSKVQSQGGAGSLGLVESPQPRVGGVSETSVEAAVLDSRPQMGSCTSEMSFPLNCTMGSHELAAAASSILNGHSGQNSSSVKPDLLPALQVVCDRVGRFRLEEDVHRDLTPPGPQRQDHSCCQTLQQTLERRLDEMERRLTQHIDQRLDSLQEGLERTLLASLPVAQLPRGAKDAAPGKPGLLNGEL